MASSLLPSNIFGTYLDSITSGKPLELLETFNDKGKFINELNEIYKISFIEYLNDLSLNHSFQDFNMENALEKAFLRLDNDISEEALTAKGENAARTLSVAMSGAVTIVAHIDGPHLHVANVGDCRAVLGVLSGKNIELT